MTRLSDSEIKCHLLWTVCRRHGWSTPVKEEDLVTNALQDTEQGRGKQLVEELLDEPYIEYQRGKGYSIKNNPDDQAKAAFRLRDTCQYTELQIETTLSRFEQAGGFDVYSSKELQGESEEW